MVLGCWGWREGDISWWWSDKGDGDVGVTVKEELCEEVVEVKR